MTVEEAREVINNMLLTTTLETEVSSEKQKKELNEKFAALYIAIGAIDKQIPTKPNGTRCLVCKRALRKAKIENGYTGKTKIRNADDYCPKCGQALDWSDNDD